MNKKTKRQLGEARQKANREASIKSGLAAQKRDHDRRKQKQADATREAQRKSAREAVNGMAASASSEG